MVRTTKPQQGASFQLYDLEKDVKQNKDFSALQEYANIEADLKGRLVSLVKQVRGDTGLVTPSSK